MMKQNEPVNTRISAVGTIPVRYFHQIRMLWNINQQLKMWFSKINFNNNHIADYSRN